MSEYANRNALAKSRAILDSALEGSPGMTKEQVDAAINELFPKREEVNISHCQQYWIEEKDYDFKIQDIKEMTYSLKSAAAAGPSGLSPDYLQSLMNDELFVKAMKALFDNLLNDPLITMRTVPLLY